VLGPARWGMCGGLNQVTDFVMRD